MPVRLQFKLTSEKNTINIRNKWNCQDFFTNETNFYWLRGLDRLDLVTLFRIVTSRRQSAAEFYLISYVDTD